MPNQIHRFDPHPVSSRRPAKITLTATSCSEYAKSKFAAWTAIPTRQAATKQAMITRLAGARAAARPIAIMNVRWSSPTAGCVMPERRPSSSVVGIELLPSLSTAPLVIDAPARSFRCGRAIPATASVQWGEPRLETLASDFIGCDYDLHSLRRGEITGGFPHVASGRFEVDLVCFTAEQNQTLYSTIASIWDRLLVGIENIEGELITAGNEFPVLLTAAGIDDV